MTETRKRIDQLKHFQHRYKERLNIKLDFFDIHMISNEIKDGKVLKAFNLNERADIYAYEHKPNKFCYILFDRKTKQPATVYNHYQFGNFIRNLK